MRQTKTVLYLSIASIALFSATACKKDKDLLCTITGPGIGQIETHRVSSESECDDLLEAAKARALNP